MITDLLQKLCGHVSICCVLPLLVCSAVWNITSIRSTVWYTIVAFLGGWVEEVDGRSQFWHGWEIGPTGVWTNQGRAGATAEGVSSTAQEHGLPARFNRGRRRRNQEVCELIIRRLKIVRVISNIFLFLKISLVSCQVYKKFEMFTMSITVWRITAFWWPCSCQVYRKTTRINFTFALGCSQK